jgi:hypothetical protein
MQVAVTTSECIRRFCKKVLFKKEKEKQQHRIDASYTRTGFCWLA